MAGTQFGIPPKQIASLDYTGADFALTPVVEAARAPITSDKNYPIDCYWRNTATRDLWWLSGFDATGALWVRLTAGSSGPMLMIPVPVGTSPVVPDGSGNLSFTSTAGSITITGGLNTINFDIAGGGIAFDQIAVDANTLPGTNPVIPTAAGQLTLTGAQVATGTVGANVIRTDSLAANTISIEIQRSTAVGATDSTKNGVSHFSSMDFTVDANGFVALAGTGGAAVQTFTVQAATAPGLTTVSPITGNVVVNASAVSAHSVPIETRSRALGAYNVEVQEAAAVAATDATKSGIAHFDSKRFTVDANGFVTTNGSGLIQWNTIAAPLTLAVNNGYICTGGGALSLALPATSVLGDIIEIALNGSTSWTITQAAGQQIRWSGSTTTLGAGGSLSTTGTGDTIRMVCMTANTIWVGLSGNGNLTVI